MKLRVLKGDGENCMLIEGLSDEELDNFLSGLSLIRVIDRKIEFLKQACGSRPENIQPKVEENKKIKRDIIIEFLKEKEKTVEEIAEELQTTCNYVRVLASKNKISCKAKESKKDKIIALLKEAKDRGEEISYKEIAEKFEVSYGYVAVIAIKNNLNVRSRKRNNIRRNIEEKSVLPVKKKEFQTFELALIDRGDPKDDSKLAIQLGCTLVDIRDARDGH